MRSHNHPAPLFLDWTVPASRRLRYHNHFQGSAERNKLVVSFRTARAVIDAVGNPARRPNDFGPAWSFDKNTIDNLPA